MQKLEDSFKEQKSGLLLQRGLWRKDWSLLSLFHNYQHIITYCCTEHSNTENPPSSILKTGTIYELTIGKHEGRFLFMPKSDNLFEKLRFCIFCSPIDKFNLTIKPVSDFKLVTLPTKKQFQFSQSYNAIQLINSFYQTSESLSLQVIEW